MLCDHLEGWDREGGRETQEGGDMGIYVYIQLIHFVIRQKLIVKQLYSNKDVKKKKKKKRKHSPLCTLSSVWFSYFVWVIKDSHVISNQKEAKPHRYLM